ncbi:hypothetical protein HG263_12155 [Pseudoalteromonas sp. JBTF-M23]|uniref:Uncharacterized protein n=1 Tax=Pseudoalteromonas caenipelagi TaxID=2726988 RepID=A0A849VEQ5_9GAMM|nr:hypothetical protein [Pseudoalteromonas caenipelagi]NOU51280.1 hypothetical protein [Pseudoalteromonas caenipelagi]
MVLTAHQQELLSKLRAASLRHKTKEVTYKSEWLGYLPYGQYHWIEVDGEEVKVDHLEPLDEVLMSLVKMGKLELVQVIQLTDEDQIKIYHLNVE